MDLHYVKFSPGTYVNFVQQYYNVLLMFMQTGFLHIFLLRSETRKGENFV